MPSSPTKGFRQLTVARVDADTRDSAILTLQPTLPFTQGQHLTLRATINGEEVRRSYSICSSPGDGTLRIGVKRAPGGLFSNWVLDTVREGATLECMGPEGEFFIQLDPAAPRRNFAAFAAGSGITPIFSLAKTTLEQEPNSTFTLFCGNRASGSVMLREDLADLKDRFLDRFLLIHILSREQQDIDLFNGRIDGQKARELLARFAPLEELDTVFLCGPAGMIEAVRPVLTGVRVKAEYFAPADQPARLRPASTRPAGCEVTLRLDGTTYRYTLTDSNESVLDGALRAGIDVRYSCKSGVCATCRAKLLEGQVDMDANYALEDYEVARGFVLCCQSFPATPAVTVDFDNQD